MNRFTKHISIILALLLTFSSLEAQRPASGFKPGKETNKPGAPETPQQREEKKRNSAKQRDKDKGKNQEDPDKPLTKRQRARKLRKQEKERKKAYYAHQNRIQEPTVRYRMNKNEKKAKKFNDRKNAPWWRKFQFNYKKKKHRKK